MNSAKSTYSSDALCESAVRAAFVRWRSDDRDVVVTRAPGRINLIGDHTDYNKGLVMPMILDHSVYVACRPISGTRHLLRSEDYDEVVSFELGTIPATTQGHWSRYVAGMLRYVPPESAVELLVVGNIPQGAGLSSSAAVEMATGLAAEAVSGVAIPPEVMAQTGQKVEHEYLGVQCGLMDQMVSRMGKSRHAFLLDCRSMTWSHIPVPANKTCFVVVNSRVRRTLAGSKYNERRKECERALAWLKASGAPGNSLRDITLEMVNGAGRKMPGSLRSRVRHVVEENERVLGAARAIRSDQWGALGQLLTASHRSLQRKYQVSCEELDTLVDSALRIDGVYGARMMGGGFGGCTLNLLDESASERFGSEITRTYRQTCGGDCAIFKVGPGTEAAVLRQGESQTK